MPRKRQRIGHAGVAAGAWGNHPAPAAAAAAAPPPFRPAADKLAEVKLKDGELRPSGIMATRPRLYAVRSETAERWTLKGSSAHDIEFHHRRDNGDVTELGAATERVEIPRTRALELLNKPGTFAWVWFTKADGTEREMWAEIRGDSADGMCVRVLDLEKTTRPQDERQFRKERLRAFVLGNGHTYYAVKRTA